MYKAKQKNFSLYRWLTIGIYLLAMLLADFGKTPLLIKIAPVLVTVVLFLWVLLHGIARFKVKHLLIFFIITLVVSSFFENLSISTGFPFGFYYYDKLIGPRILKVPFIIIFAYFGTGYLAWNLSCILLNQYSNPLQKSYKIWVPLCATFIMVMWDLCIDPLCSTIGSLWIWQEKGPYFGVPLENFFGWFFVVYIIFQLFTLYIAKKDLRPPRKTKIFWLEIVVVYGIQGLSQIMQAMAATENKDIFAAMALISVFTMLFVALITFIKVIEAKELK